MAPRKRAEATVKNADGKIEKRGRKKKNANLKSPTLIRVQVPARTVSETGTKKGRVVTAQSLNPIPADTKNSRARVVTAKALNKNEINVMLANEVVQAQFAKKPIISECQPVEPTVKRKPAPKKLLNKSKDSCELKNTKSVTLSTIDSDASAFEDTPETKPKKRGRRGWRKQNVESQIMATIETDESTDKPVESQNVATIETDKSTNKPVKRRYVTKRSLIKENSKLNKRLTQNCELIMNDESKSRKRTVKKGKASITEAIRVDNLTTVLNEVNDTTNQQSLDIETASGIHPASIGTRKASAASEAMSWTKDISSSSTTTCVTVCSNDFVRFDNKLPIVKLTNINKKLKTENVNNNKGECLTDTESANGSNCNNCPANEGNVSPAGLSRTRSLSLSSSSSSSSSSNSNSESSVQSCKRNADKIGKALDELTVKLKKFDLEIMNWIGYENENVSPVIQNYHDKIYRLLKEECEVISQCQNIKQVLLGEETNIIPDPNVNESKVISEKDVKDEDFIKPDSITKTTPDKNFNKSIDNNSVCNKNVEAKDTRRLTEETETDDNFSNILYDDKCNDDDDALSLFAESISGFESSRKNNSVASVSNLTSKESNEYVPQPIKKNSKHVETVTYHPTKITKETDNDADVKNQTVKTVCEKQNADSTSIYKESQNHKIICNDLEHTSNLQGVDESHKKSLSPINVIARSLNQQYPTFMASIYKPIQGVKSVILGGVCFFNLIFSCKKAICSFSHVYLAEKTVKSRLTRVNEETFIQEYMLLRNWSVLRRQYGLLFVLEGIRRELTRIVIEMAIDFITKANPNAKEDTNLKVEVVETVLLHLNTVDISNYADLLKFKIKNEELLCDIFMQTLAETQNFSRFKIIFINLTNFINGIPRQFSLNVATLLLERICILPYEKPLTLALLNVIKSTSPDILKHSMIRQFENQLSSADEQLYDEFQIIKDQMAGKQPVLNKSLVTYPEIRGDVGLINYDLRPNQNNSVVQVDIETRCSPDTTNMDSSNKTYKEPVITRTIDSNRIWSFGQNKGPSLDSSISSESTNSNGEGHSRDHFRKWKKRTIFDNTLMISSPGTAMVKFQGRPNFKRRLAQHRLPYGNTKYLRK